MASGKDFLRFAGRLGFGDAPNFEGDGMASAKSADEGLRFVAIFVGEGVVEMEGDEGLAGGERAVKEGDGVCATA